MYNELTQKHFTKERWSCTISSLYNKNNLIGRLFQYFFIYFETFSAPTAETLFLLVISILAMESAHSIRFLYRHFLSGITEKSLTAFYYACSYAKVDYSRFMNVTASMALKLIPESLRSQPVFFCIDDTMVSKFGKKFEDVSKLLDRKWPHAVYSAVLLFISLEHWGKLLRTEDILVIMQLHGTQTKRNWTVGESDQHHILCNENPSLSGWGICEIPYGKCSGIPVYP